MKKKHKIILLILIIFALIVVIINYYVSGKIEEKVEQVLVQQSNDTYTLSVLGVKFKLLERRIVVKGFMRNPTEKAMLHLKQPDGILKGLDKLTLSSFELRGIDYYKLLFKDEIDISKLKIADVSIHNYRNPKVNTLQDSVKKINLDSIKINKINDLRIGEIEIKNFKYQIVDVLTEKVSLKINTGKISIGGVELKKNKNEFFKLELVDKKLDLTKLSFTFFDTNYRLEIDRIIKDFNSNNIDIDNFKLKPLIDKVELGQSYKYNRVIFDVEVPKINLYNFQLRKALAYKSVLMDSIWVTGMNMDLYKDRRKPFDLKKRPKFPNILLNELKDTIRIPKISVKESRIYFESVLDKRNVHLKLSLNDVNADIGNIFSMNKDKEEFLTLDFESKFMKNAVLKADLIFPFKENKETFTMKANISKSKFKYFDSAIYPALGIKVIKGELDGMHLNAVFGSRHATGTMTMLYHDLQARIFKKNSMEKNKFLSWSVNKSLHNSNPVKGKPTRVALISADRILYKGFINYIWIAAQSGIVNTIVPFGKTVAKVQKKAAKSREKEIRREKRLEKKK